MSTHYITVKVELDDTNPEDKQQVLAAIAEGCVRNAKEDYQKEREELDEFDTEYRADGFPGPFVTDCEASWSDSEPVKR